MNLERGTEKDPLQAGNSKQMYSECTIFFTFAPWPVDIKNQQTITTRQLHSISKRGDRPTQVL